MLYICMYIFEQNNIRGLGSNEESHVMWRVFDCVPCSERIKMAISVFMAYESIAYCKNS